ncbi:EAL and modified HD-GYP domain-containing signal transduction protein [Paucibacter oligotrophus]|uniref:EAL and modified HD-GYP domain-containing signal transduction protein n=1 Tax=Roseateles oligotrophus TaxID=1769250 RepID=A0A840L9A4_9BURK|nr:EAL and modified HD-GYP domain-containing signal transduction protein [Roseateles oligotrophus]
MRTALPKPAANGEAGLCTVVGARRPLVSAKGALAGFDFQLGEALLARLLQRRDAAAGAAQCGALLAAMRQCIQQGFVALTELPLAWLLRCEQPGVVLPGMYLLIRPGAEMPAAEQAQALLGRLRQGGALLGWRLEHAPALAALGRPDFIVPVLQNGGTGQGEMSEAARRHALRLAGQSYPQTPGLPLLLLDLPDVDAMEALLAPPVALATCRLDAGSGELAAGHVLPPQARALMQLLARLVRDEDVALLAADIKADAALSVRMLQYLNSAGATPGRTLESIEQAVMVLGRDALYRWTSQMLIRLSPARPAVQALQALALARARLLEMLARAAGDARPEALYLLGLASVLPQLLHCSPAEAAAMLQLPAEASQALLAQAGPWAPYLQMAQALDAAETEQVNALAMPFGGLQAVQAMSIKAWLPD